MLTVAPEELTNTVNLQDTVLSVSPKNKNMLTVTSPEGIVPRTVALPRIISITLSHNAMQCHTLSQPCNAQSHPVMHSHTL